MEEKRPCEGQWPSAVVAVAFLGSLTVVFAVAYSRDGFDGLLRVWSLLGPLVGIAVGAIPSFFFAREAKRSEQKSKESQAAALAELTKSVPPEQLPQAIERFQAKLR